MEIVKKIKYNILFEVVYYQETEGGMVTGSHGGSMATMEEAIRLLESAEAVNPGEGWVIQCDVEKTGDDK